MLDCARLAVGVVDPADGLRFHGAGCCAVLKQGLVQRFAGFVLQCGLARLGNGIGAQGV